MTDKTLQRAKEIQREIQKSVDWRMSALEPKSTYNTLIKELKEVLGEKDAKDIGNYIHLKHIERVDKLREEFEAL